MAKFFVLFGKKMSRLAKKPIVIPSGVTVSIKDSVVSAKGPKGELSRDFARLRVSFKQDKDLIVEQGKADSALWGLAHALARNLIKGVHEGFTKGLEVQGVGYRAAVQGRKLNLELGFSHPVNVDIPAGIEAKVQKNQIMFTGADVEALGDFVAQVRRIRPPEPYKGKGVRYIGEHVRIKVGKKAAAEGAA